MNERAGVYLGYIFQYATLVAVILAIILWFLGRYQLVKLIVRILSVAFLTLGSVFVFFYVANLFLSNAINPLLISGVVFLVIGFVLHKVKIPRVK